MSIKLMNYGWDDTTGAITNPTELLVYLALADFADDDQGMCWPLISTIARKARTSERNVSRILSKFEQRHIIRRDVRYKQSTMYHLQHPEYWLPEVSGDNLSSQNEDSPDVPVSPVSEVTPRVVSGDTHVVQNHQGTTNRKAVVTNAGTWRPHRNAVTAGRAGVSILDVDLHIARYAARCIELKREPTSTEWIRWLFDDEQKARLELEAAKARELDGATDDCGVPLNQRKAAPPAEHDGPVIDWARCATDPAYLAEVRAAKLADTIHNLAERSHA